MLLVNNKRHSFLTDESGRASFELDTSGWTETVRLVVSNLRHPLGLLGGFPHFYEAGSLLQAKPTACISSTLIPQGEVNTSADSQNGASSPTFNRAYLNLQPFFSKSQSFLHIHRLKGKLSCSQLEQLQVDYILNKEALGSELQSLDVVFLVSLHLGRKGSRCEGMDSLSAHKCTAVCLRARLWLVSLSQTNGPMCVYLQIGVFVGAEDWTTSKPPQRSRP